MAIKFFTDKIQIGDYNLFEGNGGIQFDGVARAENFVGNQSFQGQVAGYSSGGANGPSRYNTVDKFPFAIDTNASDVGDLTQGRYGPAGQSSTVSGYSSGGFVSFPPLVMSNTIDKFPFAVSANATDVGDLTQLRYQTSGQSSFVFGYSSGGTTGTGTWTNTVDKFPFAADTNATDVGDLTLTRGEVAGQSSSIFGYVSGGSGAPTPTNTVDKFSFASNANATDVGDLTQARTNFSGQSSSISGYSSNAYIGPSVVNTIDKFPFATDSNATDVGDTTTTGYGTAGQSSVNYGYISASSSFSTIEKYPFATNTNATNVGSLTQVRANPSGTQD